MTGSSGSRCRQRTRCPTGRITNRPGRHSPGNRDGYFWFVGGTDDVIKSAGHLIGQFVTLKPGSGAGDALQRELIAHARTRLGPAVAPRRIEFHDTLPKNRSGKIVRRILKTRELGIPEGDVSTLEVE